MTNKNNLLFRLVALPCFILSSAVAIAQAPGPNFSKATETLGITATELATALGNPPNFVAAAEKLGLAPEELMALLPPPPANEIPEGYTADNFLQSD